MPYRSQAQQGFFNSPTGKAKIGASEVDKWNKESRGQHGLPDHVAQKGNANTGTVLKQGFQKLINQSKSRRKI